MPKLRTDPFPLALPTLILLLKDQSALTQSLVAETLGVYCADPDACIATLLELALADPDLVVRSQAIKAVGRIQARVGRTNPKTKSVLEEISRCRQKVSSSEGVGS